MRFVDRLFRLRYNRKSGEGNEQEGKGTHLLGRLRELSWSRAVEGLLRTLLLKSIRWLLATEVLLPLLHIAGPVTLQ